MPRPPAWIRELFYALLLGAVALALLRRALCWLWGGWVLAWG